MFASDGDDPEPDLALRHVQPEKDFWRLLGTPAHARLRMPLVDVTSEVEGTQLLPRKPSTGTARRRRSTCT